MSEANKLNEKPVWSIRGVSPEVVTQVKTLAGKRGMKISALVEESLRQYFKAANQRDDNDTGLEKRFEVIEAKLEMFEKLLD